jgi:xylulokinase
MTMKPTAHLVACFDIGSSAVKACLVSADGVAQRPCSVAYPLPTLPAGEQDPGDWWRAFARVLQIWWAAGADPADIAALTFSGQMQDLIALDAQGEPVRPAILYGDARAGDAARMIEQRLGADEIHRVTRNPFNAASVLPKMLHLREGEAAAWARTAKVLLGAKDFITLRLTGHAVTDPTTAATTGLFDIEQGQWAQAWLSELGLDADLLPELLEAGDRVGEVTPQAADETGLRAGCAVFCGLGDAAATTLGAGIVDASQCYAYLGTSGWVARISGRWNPPGAPLFVLPCLAPQRRIVIGPVSNAGLVHRWALGMLDDVPGASEAQRYAAFEREVAAAPPDARLLFLPYLASERLPVLTQAPQGTLTGLSAATTRGQIMRAALEGVALSLHWSFDLLQQQPPRELFVVGGATRSAAWMQIMADVFDTSLLVARDADLLPCLGAAATAAAALGWCDNAETFLRQRASSEAIEYRPDLAAATMLRRKSFAFRRLQAAVAGLPPAEE